MRRLGCFSAQWSVLVCLVTGKAISFVREGGGGVDTRGRLKGEAGPGSGSSYERDDWVWGLNR